VAAVLVDLVVVRRQLGARRDLPGQAEERAADELIVDAAAAVAEVGVGDEVVD
jgi:hypothetical protein